MTEDGCLGVDRFSQVHQVMSAKMVTVPDTIEPRAAFELLDEARRRLAPVVDADGNLCGVLTRTAALRSTLYTPAVDESNRLRIATAIGVNGGVEARAEALLVTGVDCLVIDTAHGHQRSHAGWASMSGQAAACAIPEMSRWPLQRAHPRWVAAAEYGSEGERHESDGATDEEISTGSSLCCDMLLGSIPSASNVLLRQTC